MEESKKKEIVLPLLALFLDFLPILVFNSLGLGDYISGLRIGSLILLGIALSPIAGAVLGVTALAKGKERIGLLGKIIATIAVALPTAVLALIILFFAGAMTGVISFM